MQNSSLLISITSLFVFFFFFFFNITKSLDMSQIVTGFPSN